MDSGYTTGVRKALNDKGVSDDRISYNNASGVMVDGSSFMKPEKVYNGTSYTNQNNFNNAWNNYSKSLNPTTTPTPTTQSTAYAPTTPTTNMMPTQTQVPNQQQKYSYVPYTAPTNQYTSQADDLIKQLLNYNQNQKTYDPYTSSAYKAAQAESQRAAQQGMRSAQESYGGAGFGRSTALGERVGELNNQSNEYLMTQVIPQLEAQEQARRQQEYNNLMSVLNPIFNQQNRADSIAQQDFNNNFQQQNRIDNLTQQDFDNAFKQQNRLDDLSQQGFQNRVTEGQLTGNYINQDAQNIINQLLGLKTNTENNWTNYTPEQRNAATQQADVYRNQLTSMGINPNLFGSNVSSANATQNAGSIGRTLDGQQMDENNRRYAQEFAYQQGRDQVGDNRWNQEFNYGQQRDNVADNRWNQEFQYGQERDKVADEQFAQEFNERVRQFGMNNALDWANNAISQQNANTSSFNAQTGRMQENRIATEPKETKESKVDAKTSYDNYNILTEDMGKAGTKERAAQLLQLNADYLTDADYRRMMDYINEFYE